MLTHITEWPGLPEVPPRRVVLSGLSGGDISSARFSSAHGKGTSARVWDAELCTYYIFPVVSHAECTVGACSQHFCFNWGNVEHCGFPLWIKILLSVFPLPHDPCIFIGRTDNEAEAPICWPPDAKSQVTGKDPELGKIEGRRRRGWQRMRWLDGITCSTDISLSKLGRWWRTGKPGELQSMGLQSQTWLRDWTTLPLILKEAESLAQNWEGGLIVGWLVELVFLTSHLFLYIFGCPGSLLLPGLLSSCGAQASHCTGFFCCRAQALACAGLVVLWHV